MMSFFSLSLLALTASIPGIAADDIVLSSKEDFFVFEPTPNFPKPAAAKACEFETLYDVCVAAFQQDAKVADLFQFCRLNDIVNYYNFGDKTKTFTIFAPTNNAIKNLFEEIWKVQGIGEPLVIELLESTAIEGRVERRDLECKKKPDVISNAGPNPSLVCKGDIAGNPVSYIKGKGNTKSYTPRFVDPANPIVACNADIFLVEDVILLKKYKFN